MFTRTQNLLLAAFVIAGALGGTLSVHRPAPRVVLIDPALRMPQDVRRLVERSCADCHSSAARLPFYAALPPASWWIGKDVEEARRAMDLSQWARRNGRTHGSAIGTLNAVCADVQSRHMPKPGYLLLHPGASLTPAETERICRWTRQEAARGREAERSSRPLLQSRIDNRFPPPLHAAGPGVEE